jgi:hypothetical protein
MVIEIQEFYDDAKTGTGWFIKKVLLNTEDKYESKGHKTRQILGTISCQ